NAARRARVHERLDGRRDFLLAVHAIGGRAFRFGDEGLRPSGHPRAPGRHGGGRTVIGARRRAQDPFAGRRRHAGRVATRGGAVRLVVGRAQGADAHVAEGRHVKSAAVGIAVGGGTTFFAATRAGRHENEIHRIAERAAIFVGLASLR